MGSEIPVLQAFDWQMGLSLPSRNGTTFNKTLVDKQAIREAYILAYLNVPEIWLNQPGCRYPCSIQRSLEVS